MHATAWVRFLRATASLWEVRGAAVGVGRRVWHHACVVCGGECECAQLGTARCGVGVVLVAVLDSV